MKSTYTLTKRVLDVAASATGLIVLSPALLAIASLVRVSSRGPALFRQERIGRAGMPFRLLKFRTMVVGERGPQVTAAGDKRVTSLGRILRHYKLDELPQLINVLRGDMSLVGPRPEVRRYVERFASDYERILRVRPGITDFAAIEFRDEEAILAKATDPEREYVESILPTKIRLYDKYLNRMSLMTDLAILTRTFLSVMR